MVSLVCRVREVRRRFVEKVFHGKVSSPTED